MKTDAEVIRVALRCERPDCECQRPRGRVHCPAHPDEHPSLSITARNSKVLFHCHVGCGQEAVLAVLRDRGLWRESPAGLTLDELAAAKRLPVAFLKSLGVRTIYERGIPRVRIPYLNETGEETNVRFRLALDGDLRFVWRRGDKVMLYGLQRLAEIRQAGWALLVEGESDPWAGWFHRLPVLGVPGKGTWRREWAALLAGLKLFVWQEPGAEDFVIRVAHDLPEAPVIIPPPGVKDLADLHARDAQSVITTIEHLKQQARPVAAIREDIEAAQRRRDAEEALRQSNGLLQNEHLLDRLNDTLSGLGLAGDKRNARLLYLGLTSRLLSRPVNVVIEGPSAAGKNYLISCVQALFPPEAVYPLTASSERLLAFTEADLRQRVIIVGEASGLHHDGIGATLLRTLVWEGRLIYETVEKTEVGLRPRRIEKPGPTGFITTTTRALESELATRLLTITVRDDPDQTRLVLRETGRRAASGQTDVDVVPFIAAQRWLAAAGVRDVVVPFAEILANEVDASTVRVRRDFTQLLTLIRSSALLHQQRRPRDAAGRVLATLEDYEVVYALVRDAFAAAITDDLTPAQRQAVEVVVAQFADTGGELTLRQVAERLGIDKGSASRRLARPLAKGYVLNVEDRRGRPGRYRPGEDLPNPREAIPTPETLAKTWAEWASMVHPPENARNIATPAPEAAPDGASDRCSRPLQPEARYTATPPRSAALLQRLRTASRAVRVTTVAVLQRLRRGHHPPPSPWRTWSGCSARSRSSPTVRPPLASSRVWRPASHATVSILAVDPRVGGVCVVLPAGQPGPGRPVFDTPPGPVPAGYPAVATLACHLAPQARPPVRLDVPPMPRGSCA